MSTSPRKFRRRTTVVEAMQVTRENVGEVRKWAGGKYYSRPPMRAVTGVAIPHPVADGDDIAEFGDWVVRLSGSVFRVWDEERFLEAYEPAEEQEEA